MASVVASSVAVEGRLLAGVGARKGDLRLLAGRAVLMGFCSMGMASISR